MVRFADADYARSLPVRSMVERSTQITLMRARSLQITPAESAFHRQLTCCPYVPLPGEGSVAGCEDFLPNQKSSMATSIVNLVKVLTGAGALSLSAGIADFSDEPLVGLPLGVALTVGACCCSAYTFWSIGRMCMVTGFNSYGGAFGHLCGSRAGKLIEVSVAVFCGFILPIFCVTIADLGRDLGMPLGLCDPLGSPGHLRSAMLSLMGCVVLLPVSMLRSLAALAPFSILGISGILIALGFCVLRLAQGAYAPGGEFYEDQAWRPTFNERGTRPLQSCMLVSMLAVAFIGHFSAPRFYYELEDSSPASFGKLTASGFAVSFVAMVVLMAAGFLTFGGSSQGLILNNYADTDGGALIARLGVLISVLFSYPFLLAACRDNILALALEDSEQWHKDVLGCVLVAGSLTVALLLDDMGIMVALTGALLASAVCFIFPALMFIAHARPRARRGEAPWHERLELMLNWVLLAGGVGVAVLGCGVTIQKAMAAPAAGAAPALVQSCPA